MEKLRVVIHLIESGGFSVYADEGIDVFTVDDRVPQDRVYRMTPEPIGSSLLVGDVGYKDDGSPASRRAAMAEKRMSGLAAFDVIEGGNPATETEP